MFPHIFNGYDKLSFCLVPFLSKFSLSKEKLEIHFYFLWVSPNSVHKSLARNSFLYKMNGFCNFLCLINWKAYRKS